MADRIEVDPEELGKAAEVTGSVARGVEAVGARLRSRLDALENPASGQPWGDDKMGRSFVDGKNADGYGAARTNLLTGLDNVGATLTAFAEGQSDAVRTLVDLEDGSTVNFDTQVGNRGGRRHGAGTPSE
ncbi:hypothetical protein [Nocardia higoensis]|uniref:hypothetical protein n=1 Tax=Nocardia higoensis TaxID=228599 RepID=UPI00030D42B8|nr:hypothetical protein [Nocardia higoensis]